MSQPKHLHLVIIPDTLAFGPQLRLLLNLFLNATPPAEMCGPAETWWPQRRSCPADVSA